MHPSRVSPWRSGHLHHRWSRFPHRIEGAPDHVFCRRHRWEGSFSLQRKRSNSFTIINWLSECMFHLAGLYAHKLYDSSGDRPRKTNQNMQLLESDVFCDFCQFSVFSLKAQSRFWIGIKSKAGKEKTERLRNKDITSSARGLDGCFKVHGVLTVVATKRMLYKSTCPSKLRSVGGTKKDPHIDLTSSNWLLDFWPSCHESTI